ncbi:MAG TPA: DUF6152 family protein [Vicinamibacterales bacterium]|nr:DUF6152 family protein [Vicinamibacterales bacterium]
MKKLLAGWLIVVAALVSGEPIAAHHSLANFDTTTPIRLKGTIVRFHEINPHSFLYIEVTGEDGQVRRWAVEGPPIRQIGRMGFATDALKPGTVIEVCGYAPKENTVWQIASTAPGAVSMAGRLLDAEMLVLADGKEQSWGDYGVHKCFSPGYRDVHSR